MSLLTTPEEDMDESERVFAEFVSMRLRQIDKSRKVMKKRIKDINDEQNDLLIRAEELNKMIETDSDNLNSDSSKSVQEWYMDKANEIKEETKNLSGRLEGANDVAEQVDSMHNVYIKIVNAVDEGDLDLHEAKELIQKAESKCDWLTDDHPHDLSVLD